MEILLRNAGKAGIRNYQINDSSRRYTHCEVVLGIAGHEFARNFDFSIEQNQRLSNAKSKIL